MKFHCLKRFEISVGPFLFVFVLILSTPAFSQTWLSSPADNNFNNTANWSSATVPNSASATAIFGASSTTSVTFTGTDSLGTLQFNGGAPVYTLVTNGQSISILGAGVINGSGTSQVLNNNSGGSVYLANGASAGTLNIDNAGLIQLNNTASAGGASITNNSFLDLYDTTTLANSTVQNTSNVLLSGSSSAGSARINNTGTWTFSNSAQAASASIYNNGFMTFNQTTSAASASIRNDSTLGFYGSSTAASSSITNTNTLSFFGTSTAANAAITNSSVVNFWNGSNAGNALINNLNTVVFGNTSSAASATIINNGSSLLFQDNASAGSASIFNVMGSSINFVNNSVAGTAILNNDDSILFTDNSSAQSATILNNNLAHLVFDGTAATTFSTAGNAQITNDYAINFNSYATAGNSHITNNNTIVFDNNSTAGSATIQNNGTANLSFLTNSSAGSASITNNNSLSFDNNASAGSATIGNNGNMSFGTSSSAGSASVSNAAGATIMFNASSNGGSATILNKGYIQFNTSASAGSATIANNSFLYFYNNADAGSSSVSNSAGASMFFFNNASAASATIANNGNLQFAATATGGNSTITNGGNLLFTNSSTAGAATIINNAGATVQWAQNADGGTAQVTNAGAFVLNNPTSQNVTIGSIAGTGTFYLGTQLVAGTDNLSTTVSGLLSGGGGLTKTGLGTLTLTGSNNHTGPTTIDQGTLDVTSDNALGNGGMVINNGTLQTGAGIDTAGRLIQLGAAATIDSNGFNSLVSGVLSGSGSLTKVGSGTVTLSATNTYSGATSINGGVLNISTMSNLGSAGAGGLALGGGTLQVASSLNTGLNITLNAAGGGFDTNGNTLALGGTISGVGALTKTGSGALTLSGTNSYSGGTDFNGGTVDVGNDNNLGTGILAFNGGTLQTTASISSTKNVSLFGTGAFDTNGFNSTLSGIISGSGTLTKTGAGSLTLTGASSATGTFDIAQGSLVTGTANVISSAAVSVEAPGLFDLGGNDQQVAGLTGSGTVSLGGNTLAVNNSSGNLFGGLVAGTGTLTHSGSGALTLTGNNTYSGGTSLTAGILAVGSDANLGTGNLSFNGGTLQFTASVNSNKSITLVGAGIVDTNGFGSNLLGTISGSGSFAKTGAGALTILGTNTYSGGTSLNGGVVVINNDNNLGVGNLSFNGGTLQTIASITSSKNVALVGNGTFDTNGQNSTLSGVISGAGAFNKNGAGTLTLLGNNGYAGGTALNAGSLVVGNTNALGTGSVAVNGGLLADNGAALTMTVGGNYSQAAGGTLQLGLGGTGAGQWDVVNVTGTASLGGTLAVTLYSGYIPQVGDSLLVLSASSLSGRFSQLNNPQGSRWYPVYQNTQLSLLAIQPAFKVSGLTSNQTAVGAWLDQNYLDPSLVKVVPAVGVDAKSALGGDFDLLAPTALTPLFKMGFSTADSQAFLVERRLAGLAGDGGNSASAFASQMGDEPLYAQAPPMPNQVRVDAPTKGQSPADRNWDVFVEGTGDLATITGDTNAAGYQYSLAGVSGGADYLVSPQIKAGLLLGFSQGAATGTGSKVNVSGGTAGLFAGWRQENLHAEALASGAINQYTTSRAGYGGTATGTTQGQQISGYLNLGYDWRFSDNMVGGFLSGRYSNVAVNAFQETGSQAPLAIPAQNETFFSGEVGVRYSPRFKLGDSTLSPFLSAAWEQIFQGYQDSLSAGMSGLGNFSVMGPATGQGAVVLQGGANARISNSFSVYAQYEGRLGMSNFVSHNFSGGVNFGF